MEKKKNAKRSTLNVKRSSAYMYNSLYERAKFWTRRIELAWEHAPIVRLTGVRRAGKTTLAKAFEGAEYVNCDLPRNRERLSDPEFYFSSSATTAASRKSPHWPSRVG